MNAAVLSNAVVHLVIMMGALLIAAGCLGPLRAAVATSNAAALTLTDAHDRIVAASISAQREAAARVQGNREDPSVRAEQIDRATEAGKAFRPIWDAYDAAWKHWVTAVAMIKAAQVVDEAGEEPDVQAIARLLMVLADAQRELAEVFQ